MNAPLRLSFIMGLGLVLAGFAQSQGAPPGGGRTTDLEVGFEERVRSENWDDITDWNDETEDERKQWRFRTRVWSRLNVGDRLELFVNFNSESRAITTPDTPTKFDEVVIENLYLDFRFNRRCAIRVGRQNLIRGEGFHFIEGNPWDGSRSMYYNALDFTLNLGRRSRLELIGISNPRRDIYLPRINDQDKILVEWNEQAVGLYFTGQEWPATSLEAYGFYKVEANDYRPVTHPQYQPEKRFFTVGGRLSRELGRGWSAAGEAALQWGRQHPDRDIRAWSGYAYLKKTFDTTWKPSLQFGYWGFSGDDPETSTQEGWSPLFSRWPAWSELYIYTQLSERGIAYWTNASLWRAEAILTPWKPLKLRASYYHLRSFYPFPGNPSLYATGGHRGDLFEARLDFTINANWRGHVVYEGMAPGNFYRGDDPGYFFRFEIIFTIKKNFSWRASG